MRWNSVSSNSDYLTLRIVKDSNEVKSFYSNSDCVTLDIIKETDFTKNL